MIRRSIFLTGLAVFALAGCRGGTSDKPPVLAPSKIIETEVMPVTNMTYQPKHKSQSASNFWPDGRAARMPPEGTLARGSLKADPAFFRGLDEDGKPLQQYPVEVTTSLVQRGQQRYDVFCAVCHDQLGEGRGLVPTRGWVPPPTFHQERIRQMVPGELFHIVSNGVRTMPGYAKQIPESDRWAIVAYIQALQRSHYAKAEDIPADQRNQLR